MILKRIEGSTVEVLFAQFFSQVFNRVELGNMAAGTVI